MWHGDGIVPGDNLWVYCGFCMETFRNYINLVRRFKAAFAMNLLGLSVALAVASLILMQVRYDLTFDSSIRDREDICLLVSDAPGIGRVGLAPRPLEELAASFPGVREAALVEPMSSKIFVRSQEASLASESFRTDARAATEGFVRMFGFEFVEKVPGEPLASRGDAVIPLSLAEKVFGKGTGAVGKKIESAGDGRVFTVTGVYRDFPSNCSLANGLYSLLDPDRDVGIWGNCNYNLFMKLYPGTSDFGDALWDEVSSTELADIVSSMELVPLDELHFTGGILFDTFPKADPVRLVILLAVAFAVMVIACINMMNYNTALAPVRAKSVNTMKVLGSPRSRLCMGIIAESAVTGALAWALSVGAVLALRGSGVAEMIDPEITFSGQLPVFFASLGAALVLGVLSGTYPALYVTSFPPALVLKGNLALSPKGKRIRMVLVGFQFAVSFFLISGIAVVMVQNRYMKNADSGYDRDALIAVPLDGRLDRAGRDLLADGAADIPGVESVAFADILMSAQDNVKTWGREIAGESRKFNVISVSGDFFGTVGAGLTQGRGFRGDGDRTRWIFNETARKAFGLTCDDSVDGCAVVGFVNDIRLSSFRKGISPAGYIYDPDGMYHDEYEDIAYFRVSPAADMQAVRAEVLETLSGLVPDYRFESYTSGELFRLTYGKEREFALMISLFGAIAVVISLVGVSGLVMFDSESRRKEIAVRKVMGASSASVLGLFNRSYMLLLAVSVAVSAPLSGIFAARWLGQFSQRADYPWWSMPAAALLLAAVTAVTVSLQCMRAAGRNPVDNLKSE